MYDVAVMDLVKKGWFVSYLGELNKDGTAGTFARRMLNDLLDAANIDSQGSMSKAERNVGLWVCLSLLGIAAKDDAGRAWAALPDLELHHETWDKLGGASMAVAAMPYDVTPAQMAEDETFVALMDELNIEVDDYRAQFSNLPFPDMRPVFKEPELTKTLTVHGLKRALDDSRPVYLKTKPGKPKLVMLLPVPGVYTAFTTK